MTHSIEILKSAQKQLARIVWASPTMPSVRGRRGVRRSGDACGPAEGPDGTPAAPDPGGRGAADWVPANFARRGHAP